MSGTCCYAAWVCCSIHSVDLHPDFPGIRRDYQAVSLRAPRTDPFALFLGSRGVPDISPAIDTQNSEHQGAHDLPLVVPFASCARLAA